MNTGEPAPMVPPSGWTDGTLPENVRVGPNTVITGQLAFKRFFSTRSPAVTLGANCTMDNVHFALGPEARLEIGSYCCFTSTILLVELELRIGSYVFLGWNVTIADTDFHPIAPAERIADTIACSPLGKGRSRPFIDRQSVIIEDDVWVGPNAAILKGVHVGQGAFIEPGAIVTREVPPRSRVRGNPARVVGTT